MWFCVLYKNEISSSSCISLANFLLVILLLFNYRTWAPTPLVVLLTIWFVLVPSCACNMRDNNVITIILSKTYYFLPFSCLFLYVGYLNELDRIFTAVYKITKYYDSLLNHQTYNYMKCCLFIYMCNFCI